MQKFEFQDTSGRTLRIAGPKAKTIRLVDLVNDDLNSIGWNQLRSSIV